MRFGIDLPRLPVEREIANVEIHAARRIAQPALNTLSFYLRYVQPNARFPTTSANASLLARRRFPALSRPTPQGRRS
jgi:hypothetical protein